MTEQIGKVKINDTCYPGEDLYSDGDIEEVLLSVVKEYAPQDYEQQAIERKDWALFYHLSPIRENIIRWYPMKEDATVLEVGSGCGAITGILADKAKQVTCIELSKRRSLINAYKNKDKDNIEILLGNFETVEESLEEKYDYITLIGVFEYGAHYITSDNPYEDFLAKLKRHLKPDGRLLIAIENKNGLKYWAGCREDHVGAFYEGIEGYSVAKDQIRTFSENEWERLAKKCGFNGINWYFPYPDYKFPVTVYGKGHMPKPGDLRANRYNMDRDRIFTFDENKVWDEIIKDGGFSYFSNSYFIELSFDSVQPVVPASDNDKERDLSVMEKFVIGGRDAKEVESPAGNTFAIKLYFDRGNGFSEEDTVTKTVLLDEENRFAAVCMIPGGVGAIRIDPGEDPIVIRDLHLFWEQKRLKVTTVNGKWDTSDTFSCDHIDPWILMRNIRKKSGELLVSGRLS